MSKLTKKALSEMKQEQLVDLAFELQSVNAEVAKELETANKNVNELTSKLESAPKQEDLDAANSTIKELNETVVELNKRLSASEKSAPSKELIKVKGKEYAFDGGKAHFNGHVITADTLRKDSKMAEELVSMGVGYLKEV